MFFRQVFLFVLLFSFTFFDFAIGASLVLDPQYPAPGDTVKASLQAGRGEYISNVTWFVKQEPYSENIHQITIKTKKADTELSLQVAINFANKKPQVITKKIKLGSVNIAYEADTFVPDFLDIAPLNSMGSNIKLSAFVKIPGYKKSDLLYIWKKDGKTISEISGQGQDSATVKSDFFARKQSITLDLLDPKTSKLISSKTIFIYFKGPEILTYTKDDILGWLLTKEVNGPLVIKKAKELLAVPLNMSAKYLFDPHIVWSWYVDDVRLPDESGNFPYVEVSFNKTQRDSAKIKVEASYKEHLLQRASKEILIKKPGGESKRLQSDEKTTEETSGFGI